MTLYIIIAIGFILLGIKLFSWARMSWKDYKHWDGIIGSRIAQDSHANYVLQFVFGLAMIACGVAILAVTLQ